MTRHRARRIGLAVLIAAATLTAAEVRAAADSEAAPPRVAKHLAPIPEATLALMRAKDTSPAAPMLVRVFKKEAELEVWKQVRGGAYVLLKTFPICRWSGELGPKRRQGDRQAPEGFYAVSASQMNPNSAYYLSFDTGFPNAYDRANGATGSALMVHGTCSSAGCYAMTDAGIAEIYALARETFEGGQKAFQFHAYPFRMNAENMVKHRGDPNIAFWRQLKEGHDRFEATREALSIAVSGRRYAFGAGRGDEDKIAAYRAREEERMQHLLASGLPAVRTTYADGGQHGYFAKLMGQGTSLGEVSQPETLAYAGREVALSPQPAIRIAAAALFAPLPALSPAARPAAPAEERRQEAGPIQLASAAMPTAPVFAAPLPPLPEAPKLRPSEAAPPAAPPTAEPAGILRFASASLIAPAQAAPFELATPSAAGMLPRWQAGSIAPLSQTGLLGLLSMLLILGYPGLQHLRARRLGAI